MYLQSALSFILIGVLYNFPNNLYKKVMHNRIILFIIEEASKTSKTAITTRKFH